jgi:hypothetical protein
MPGHQRWSYNHVRIPVDVDRYFFSGRSHEVGEIRRGRQSWLQCGDINTEVGLSHGRHHLIFLAIIVGLLTVAVLLVGRRRSSGVNSTGPTEYSKVGHMGSILRRLD